MRYKGLMLLQGIRPPEDVSDSDYNGATENAGVKNVAPDSRGGKRQSRIVSRKCKQLYTVYQFE